MAVGGESVVSVGRQALNPVREAGNLPAREPGGGVGAETVIWGSSILALRLVLPEAMHALGLTAGPTACLPRGSISFNVLC